MLLLQAHTGKATFPIVATSRVVCLLLPMAGWAPYPAFGPAMVAFRQDQITAGVCNPLELYKGNR